MVTPPMVMLAVPLAVKVPGVLELIVSVQVAVSLTTCGAPQVFDCVDGAGVTDGVIELKTIGPTVPDALAVIVKTWAVPTGFTPSGVIEIDALTQCLIS